MIDDVMYGMIPRAKTDSRVRAPPENRFNNPTNPEVVAESVNCLIAVRSTPGTGMVVPSRYRTKMNSVKRILFRRSWIRNAFLNAVSMGVLSPSVVASR
jgi:hypothetical protein